MSKIPFVGYRLLQDEEFPPSDPGNELRKQLGTGNIDSNTYRNIGELLYTACERGLLELESVSAEDAILIWMIIEVAARAAPEEINRMRM